MQQQLRHSSQQQCCRWSRRTVACLASSRRRERGDLHSKVAFTEPVVLPTELLRSDYAEKQLHSDVPLTVYSCRISTGNGRGAALSDPYQSAVNLCLIGKDGRSVMHRIIPVNDPQEAKHEVEQMCQIIDDDSVGADCITSLAQHEAPSSLISPSPAPPPAGHPSSSSGSSSYVLPPKPPPAPRFRFQEGCVDEFVFLAPELGPLAGVLVGTEQATWQLEELQVSSSRTHHVDRFVCRQLLGGQAGQGACFLSPVPPGAVVYGTGESQLMLSKEQASTLHQLNMDAYAALKQRLLSTTFLLTASGTWVAGLAAGLDAAVPFALGGLTGVLYQWLLQQGVDGIVATVSQPGGRKRASGSPPHTGHPVKGGDERPLQATSTLLDEEQFTFSRQSAHEEAVEVEGPDGIVRVVGTSKASSSPQGSPAVLEGGLLRKLLSGPAIRIAFLGAAIAVLVTLMLSPDEPTGSAVLSAAAGLPTYREHMWKLVVALLGFMTYKVALVSVSLSTPAPTLDAAMATGTRKSSTGHEGHN